MNVEMPDGTIITDVPEGTTKAELLRKYRGLQPDSTPAPPERSFGQELMRQGGLTARNAVNAAMSLPNMVMDPINQLIGLPRLSDAANRLMSASGLPQPESAAEHIAAKGSEALVPGGLVSKAAGMVKNAPKLVAAIAASPMAETISSGIGGMASESAAQAGLPAWAQIGAGIVAPNALNAAVGAGKTAYRAANEIRRPLTQAGQEQVAADVLGRITQDKKNAIGNLQAYATLKELERQTGKKIIGVEGSNPTAAAVAADYGLTGGQQVISRGDASPIFAQDFANNNQARIDALAKLKATEEQVAAYVAKRDQITSKLREQVWQNTKGPVDYAPVAEKIGQIVATPEGGRVESQKALNWLTSRLMKYSDESRTDPRNAYELHKDIGDLVAGRVKDENGSALRLAGGLANEVKKELATQIDKAAPGFKKYLETYSRLSKPIERLGIISDRLGGEDLNKITNALPLTTPGGASYALSQNKVKNAVQRIQDETRLAPRQEEILGKVLGDLNAETSALRGGKMPGSDTYQNMAAANFVNRVLGQTLAESAGAKWPTKAAGLLMKPFEPAINDMVVKAYRDPEEMLRLLKKARTNRADLTLAAIGSQTIPWVTGGLLGSLVP